MSKLLPGVSLLGLVTAVGAAVAMLGAGLGYRLGLWPYGTGIATLATVFWVAVGAAALSLAVVVLALRPGIARRVLVIGLIGVVVAGVSAWIPYDLRTSARSVPAIHDISTDLENPPAFVRVATLRAPDEHPVAYDGPEVADLQRKAYPDLAPLVLLAPRDVVVPAARATLVAMGLDVVDVDPEQGRIEATATSMLFGFKDDVVVRIGGVPGATKVDVRSKSRVGRSDLGMNARRIRTFLSKLEAALG